jgi:hypothetical protein
MENKRNRSVMEYCRALNKVIMHFRELTNTTVATKQRQDSVFWTGIYSLQVLDEFLFST